MTNFRNPVEVEVFVREALAKSPSRIEHIFAVGRKAKAAAETIKRRHPEIEIDPDFVYCAALLHDIGYAESIAQTGFHPLDGYNFLCRSGYPDLAAAIVGHSSAPEHAQLSGISLPDINDSVTAKIITYCDAHIKQGGAEVTYQERVNDIVSRYGTDSITVQACHRADPRIRAIISEIEQLLS